MEYLPYIIPLVGFIATGGAAFWRIGALERRAEKRDEQAREDRKLLHEQINRNTIEIAELRGELRGKGMIE